MNIQELITLLSTIKDKTLNVTIFNPFNTVNTYRIENNTVILYYKHSKKELEALRIKEFQNFQREREKKNRREIEFEGGLHGNYW